MPVVLLHLDAAVGRPDSATSLSPKPIDLYHRAAPPLLADRELCSELQEELDEARQRLRTQLDANQALTRQLADANSRLELTEIRLTQLGGGEGAGSGGGGGAEERAAAAERESAQLRAERDAASVQFREYTAALSARLQQAESARDTLTAELAARDDQAAAAAAAATSPPTERPPEQAAVQQTPPPVTAAERQELEQLRQAAAGAAEEADTLRRELRALVGLAAPHSIGVRWLKVLVWANSTQSHHHFIFVNFPFRIEEMPCCVLPGDGVISAAIGPDRAPSAPGRFRVRRTRG